MISQYWVGQKPTVPLTIDVEDQNGASIDLTQYTGFAVSILDPDNYDVMTPDFTLDTTYAEQGRLILTFPASRSIFEKTGDYLLRFEFSNSNGIDFTNVYTMPVAEFGGEDIGENGVVL